MEAKQVLVLSADLMDRSKIAGAFPDATVVRSVDKLLESAGAASLLIVDLARLDDPAALADVEARIIGFGSHVNADVLAAAEGAGIEAMPRSVFFKRLTTGDL